MSAPKLHNICIDRHRRTPRVCTGYRDRDANQAVAPPLMPQKTRISRAPGGTRSRTIPRTSRRSPRRGAGVSREAAAT